MGRKKWCVQRMLDNKSIFGGCFKEDELQQARLKSDSLVYQIEQKTGEKARYKLNFPGRNPPQVVPSSRTYEGKGGHGVYWDKVYKKWYVRRPFDGKYKSGGYFKEHEVQQARLRSDSL